MSCKRFTSGTKPLPSVCVCMCCRPAPPSADARTRWCDMVCVCVCLRCTRVGRSSGRRCQRRTARGLMSSRAWGDKWQLLLKLPSGNIGTYVDRRHCGYSTYACALQTNKQTIVGYVSSSKFFRACYGSRGWSARVYAACRLVGWLFFRKPNEYFAGERVDGRERIVAGWGDFGTR